jgi:hypothetical protein
MPADEQQRGTGQLALSTVQRGRRALPADPCPGQPLALSALLSQRHWPIVEGSRGLGQLVAVVPLRSVDPSGVCVSDRGGPADAVPWVGGLRSPGTR